MIAALVLGSLAGPLSLHAAQYALLVGVSHYPALPPEDTLEGPGPDVVALKELLTKRFGFQARNVIALQDAQATKQNILDQLAAMVTKAAAGDLVLFYFSGHGTSAFDQGLWQLADMIGPNSGALIPYDLKADSLDELGQSMIIGRRDVRPILSRLNKDALAWVVLDSCYSENAARAVGQWEGPSRGISLVGVVKADSTARQASVADGKQAPMQARVSTESSEPYPYPNVVSFSAASRNEKAEDINSRELKQGVRKTIDGQPHGAFTNGLLLAMSGDADSNHDGIITFDELFRYTRDEIHASQTPQMLPDQGDISHKAVFMEARAVPAPAPSRPASPAAPRTSARTTKVALDGVDASLDARIRTLPGVEIVPGDFDLLVRREKNVLALYQPGPRLIREYSPAESAAMLTRIAAQANVEELSGFRFPAQTFNLTVDADPVIGGVAKKDFQAALRIGQKAAISVSTEKPVYLLVLDIDKEGVISVLYPGPSDPQPFSKTKPEAIFKADAQAPAGTEIVKAFGFIVKPAGFDEFTCHAAKNDDLDCPTIMPGDARYQRLLAMLASSAVGRAEAHAAMLTKE
jgi:hypothetical protein